MRRLAPWVLALAAGAAGAQSGAPAQGPAAGGLPVYTLDPTHTFVSFEIRPAGLSTARGRFDRKQGRIAFDRAARRGEVEIEVATASVSTGVPAFDALLRGESLLASERHPTARFVGERFDFEGDRVSAVAGTLTLRGRTQPLTLRATRFACYANPLFQREVCGGDFEAPLRHRDFGIAAPAGVPEEVRLVVQVEAIRQ
ncbi:MAG: polyisoprenoid-binding protein [Rubrivivax sp.]|nr:polyisoprenoid-binding protein [Rubrivivax sp.]